MRKKLGIYIGLLRAINVGGTGLLPMADLRALCGGLGFTDVRTYIQSGNVVFGSNWSEARIKAALEETLSVRLGKPAAVLVRSAAEMQAVLDGNPFRAARPNQVSVLFLDRPPAGDAFAAVTIPGREEIRAIRREVYVHYPDGMGRSKLKLPAADIGTARNLNTVARLAEMANETAQSS